MPYRLLDRLKVFLSAFTDHPALVKWELGAVITAFGSQIQQHACLAVYSLSCNRRKCPFTLLVRQNSSGKIHLCRPLIAPFSGSQGLARLTSGMLNADLTQSHTPLCPLLQTDHRHFLCAFCFTDS